MDGFSHSLALPAFDLPNLCAAQAFALATTSCRFFGAAVDWSEDRSRPEILATSSTAAKNAASFAFEGRLKPLIFLTNCSEAAWISISVTGGSKLNRVLMFLHMPLHLSHLLQRPPVEVLNRNAFQVDSFETANIDCGHPIALWIGAFSVRVNTTRLAKTVLDHVFVKRVRTDVVIQCEHVQLIARHKPQERAFARTYRAIACHRPVEVAFHLERNLAAVTATLVLHVRSPFYVLVVTEISSVTIMHVAVSSVNY
jgi:hypothetical protein